MFNGQSEACNVKTSPQTEMLRRKIVFSFALIEFLVFRTFYRFDYYILFSILINYIIH